jgi:hypothetical protein
MATRKRRYNTPTMRCSICSRVIADLPRSRAVHVRGRQHLAALARRRR